MPTWAPADVAGMACVRAGCAASEVPELQGGAKLLRVVERWLRGEREGFRAAEAADAAAARSGRAGAPLPKRAGPLMPTKHMMFYKG